MSYGKTREPIVFHNGLNILKEHLILIWGAGALIVFCWFAVSYFRFVNHLDGFSRLPSEEDEAVFRSLAGKYVACL